MMGALFLPPPAASTLNTCYVPTSHPGIRAKGMGRALESQVLGMDHLGPLALSGLRPILHLLCPWP